MNNLLIKPESPAEQEAIWMIHRAAFGRSAEADLVNAIRNAGQMTLSLVARSKEMPVGHILYSPVSLETNPQHYRVWGLGPIAVLPEYQRQGVGRQLIKTSLEQCKGFGVDTVVLLGHTSYYPKFGFEPASRYGLKFKGEDFGDAFMVLELRKGALASLAGAVHYVPAFDESV